MFTVHMGFYVDMYASDWERAVVIGQFWRSRCNEVLSEHAFLNVLAQVTDN